MCLCVLLFSYIIWSVVHVCADIPSSDDDDLFQPASRSSVSVEHHSPSGVAIHPTMDITGTFSNINYVFSCTFVVE